MILSVHIHRMSNPEIKQFMTETLKLNGSDYNGLEQYYNKRLIDIVKSKRSKIMIWEDPIEHGIQVF